jgi:Tfp pilus assembly protein PilP
MRLIRASQVAAVMLSAVTQVHAQNAEVAATVEVRDVRATSLLVAVANATRSEFAYIGDPAARLSIAGTFKSPRHFFEEASRHLGLSVIEVGGVFVLASPACQPVQPYLPIALQREPVTLNFVNISPAGLAQVFADLYNLPLDEASKTSQPPKRIVALSVRNRDGADVVKLLSAYAGTTIRRLPGSRFGIEEAPRTTCDTTEHSPEQLAEFIASAVFVNVAVCPRVRFRIVESARTSPCQPLEFYPVEQLSNRGKISVGAKTGALVETPSGMAYVALAGDRIGTAFGQVSQVDEHGMVVIETIRRPDGTVSEVTIRIGHDNSRLLLAGER